VSRENLRATGTLADDPAEDKDVLNIVVSQQASSGLYLPTMNGIVSTVLSAKDRLEPSAVSLKNTVRDVARERLSRADTDRAEKAKIDNAPTQPRRTRATLSLIEVLLRVLFRTAPKTMEPNDTFDLLHAAVPIAYCDFVLLDRTWCAVAVQAIREMREAGVTAPLANVYSGKKGEVERFLAALEAYPPKQSMLTSEKTSEKGIS
jgi:hypothetical protein